MRVAMIGGGAMAQAVSALKILISRAAERSLDVVPEVMDDLAGMSIDAIVNACDDGPSTRALRAGWGVSGYYADAADILGVFCPDPRLAKLFKTRFPFEIEGGRSLGDLMVIAADWFAAKHGDYGDQRVRDAICLLGEGLTEHPAVWALLEEALHYRFQEDGFKGHSFRNLFHFALEQTALNRKMGRRYAQELALEALNVMYKVPARHRVRTVAWDAAVLHAETRSGDIIAGQSKINLRGLENRYPEEFKRLFLVPPVEAPVEVAASIIAADILILSSGDFFTTILPALLVGGIQEAVLKSSAEIVYIANQMTRQGETLYGDRPYTVADLIPWIETAIGRHPHRIIYDTTPIPRAVLQQKRYRCERKLPLGDVPQYLTSPDLERPLLIKKRFGVEASDGCWIHDPEALALLGLLPVFSEVRAGALS